MVTYGTYALVILHDENENNKMDYSTSGRPEEGYGFSKDAKGMFGPPDFKNAHFSVHKSDVNQTIKIIY